MTHKCEVCSKSFKNKNALEMHNKSKHYSKRSGGKVKVVMGAIAAVIIIGALIFFFFSKPTGEVPSNGSAQQVTISFRSNYAPNTIEVNAGTPVIITLDSSVQGCYRDFQIPKLGISKYSTSPFDTISFTPKKPGTYRFQCSMGMGYGTLIVK